MTSLATIASAVPLAMGYGPGAETRAPLARSIIGGMFLSTLVTLVIVPVFYVLFDRFGSYVTRLARGEKTTAHEPPAASEPAVADAVAAEAAAKVVPELEPAL